MDTPQTPAQFPIWPGLAPGETTEETGYLREPPTDVQRLTGVTSPRLYAYSSSPGEHKPAIIVLPGGGYEILAADLEGGEVAQWLAGLGFVAAVLHYRVPDNKTGAYQDARRAISWLRAYAADFGIDPKRVGVLGFSAGGHLTARLAANGSERPYAPIDEIDSFDCRPDFAAPIYPAWLISKETGTPGPEVAPNAAMPPLFLAQSRDDGHFCTERYAEFARSAGANVTSKVYESGGHGYGIRLAADVPASRWTKDAAEWLRQFTNT
jgi:acetyl esterase/lipase